MEIELDPSDPLHPDFVKQPVKGKSQHIARAPLKSGGSHFSLTPLWWLTDPRHQKMIGARERVLLWLWYATFQGEVEVRFTNRIAAALGLTKNNKSIVLRQLEAGKFIECSGEGNETVWVKMLKALRVKRADYHLLEEAEWRHPGKSRRRTLEPRQVRRNGDGKRKDHHNGGAS